MNYFDHGENIFFTYMSISMLSYCNEKLEIIIHNPRIVRNKSIIYLLVSVSSVNISVCLQKCKIAIYVVLEKFIKLIPH